MPACILQEGVEDIIIRQPVAGAVLGNTPSSHIHKEDTMNKQCVIAGLMLLSLIMLPGSLVADDIPLAGENIARMEVDFTWTEKHTCKGPSPEVKLSNVPVPVVQFTVYLRDMTKPGYFHGGGIVQKRFNKIIKEGELKSYYGPCFTDGPPRNFVMRVYGLDVDGKIIAYGEKILPYPIE